MENWLAKLREQTVHIKDGNYQQGLPNFGDAPAGIAELSRDLDELAAVMAEREAVRLALAREVHHRVKNNLQIVTSLLNMQANRIENPVAREALGQTRARIGALALIHRILYEKEDDGSQGTLDISRLIGELCAEFHLWQHHRSEITLSCEAQSFAVPLDTAMPLALFAVEAVTNAYAYAFPGGRSGTVLLKFSADPDGEAVLSVTDSGIGFDNTKNDQSMGRQLMNGFAHQLGGTMKINSSAASGTEVRLDYRIAV